MMINLYWYKYTKGKGNFGDELNPYLFAKLTNAPFRYVNVKLLKDNKRQALKVLASYLWHKKISLCQFIRYLFYNFISHPLVFLCIGSILDHCDYSKVLIWGSGIISEQSRVPRGTYLAVRGAKSLERVNKAGVPCPNIIGDPAILLPMVYKPSYKKKYKIGIIPHIAHYNAIRSAFNQEGFVVIDLLTEIEDIIDTINQCEITVSTSLHGIIVSHAYGIKSAWAKVNEINLSGDNIKYNDYFSSVNINNYSPININILKGLTAKELAEKLQLEYANYLLPVEHRIINIQNNLLRTFPFPLKIDLIQNK